MYCVWSCCRPIKNCGGRGQELGAVVIVKCLGLITMSPSLSSPLPSQSPLPPPLLLPLSTPKRCSCPCLDHRRSGMAVSLLLLMVSSLLSSTPLAPFLLPLTLSLMSINPPPCALIHHCPLALTGLILALAPLSAFARVTLALRRHFRQRAGTAGEWRGGIVFGRGFWSECGVEDIFLTCDFFVS